MIQPSHPDALTDYRALKAITRGGTQSADTAAMEAYYDALSEGKTVDEAGEVFIKTYQKGLYGKANFTMEGSKRRTSSREARK